MSIRTHHHGHVHGSRHCPGAKTDIHGVSGIPNLRKQTPTGVANKKVQMEMDRVLLQIKSVRGQLASYSYKPQDAIYDFLSRDLEDLQTRLAQLREREYAKPPKRQSPKKPISQARLSPPSTTDSNTSSRSNSVSPAYSRVSVEVEEPAQLPRVLPKQIIKTMPAVNEAERLVIEKPVDINLAEHLVMEQPVEEPVNQPAEQPLDAYLQASDDSPRIYDSDAESIDFTTAKPSLTVIEPSDEELAMRARLEDAYVETADKVCQVYAIAMTDIARGGNSPLIVMDGLDQPLVEEIEYHRSSMREQIRTGKKAIEEDVLPHFGSDYRLAKKRLLQEREEHRAFIQNILDTLPEKSPERARLAKFLPSSALPDDPSISRSVLSSYYQSIPFDSPTLPQDAVSQLRAKAQLLPTAELGARTAKYQALLSSVESAQIICLEKTEPHVVQAIAYRKEIDVMPQGYIDAYTGVLSEEDQRHQNDRVLDAYLDGLRDQGGSYQDEYQHLRGQRAVICKFVQEHVRSAVRDPVALETAMNAFEPRSR